MSLALVQGLAYQDLGYYASPGVGDTSIHLAEFVKEEAAATFRVAISLQAKLVSIFELSEVYKSCAMPDWDGEGAEPIPFLAYQEAARFLRLLPMIFPMPDVVPEPNGQVGFEWRLKKRHMFVVAIGGNQSMTFAGLFGSDSGVHGTEPFFDAIPESIIANLQRLYSSE
jgi:hypothetical protein